MQQVIAAFDAEISQVRAEFIRSLDTHGTWEGYSHEDMFKAIAGEYMEAAAARELGDIHGEHGMVNELRQTAAMCIKANIKLMEGK